MSKINILDSKVYNRIAAGEVVERPASVVKEFVENSIDAGAKNIEIRIERGGKDLIAVSDDGCGIEKSDLTSAFLPHATSKISCAEDLDLIQTLGFRGEALASVASVANVTIRSKSADFSEAYSLNCVGGKIGEIMPCARDQGTEITAETLFFNTPVREKFLKTDKGEESEVSAVVARFILGNPTIAFRYFIDGKMILQSFGGGEEEAVAAIYGAGTISECYRIEAERNGIRIHGYIGKPSFTKSNRTYQNVFVNGRHVVNNTVSSAIGNAYASYLMKRQYPFYVLFLDIPPEIVDVNVHPNKSDVRFENNQVIYGAVYKVISSVLDGNASALEYVVQPKGKDIEMLHSAQVAENLQVKEDIEKSSKDILKADFVDKTFSTDRIKTVEKASGSIPHDEVDKEVVLDKRTLFGIGKNEEHTYPDVEKANLNIEFRDSGAAIYSKPLTDTVFTETRTRVSDKNSSVFEENKKQLEKISFKAQQQKIIFENAVYDGCIFNTYLVYEEGNNVYLIDQHAAHERLLFDRLKDEMERRVVIRQPMLIPYILKVNAQEAHFLAENLDKLNEIGFETDEFGTDSYKISTVPADLQDIDLGGFFSELLSETGGLRGIRLAELLRDKIAMTACKHAVKGGMRLSDSEKAKLFEMLRGDMGLKCPHGRPIAVRMTKSEIEKMFKRIV